MTKRHLLILRWTVPTVIAVGLIAALVYLLSTERDDYAAQSDGTITGLSDTLRREISDEEVRFSFREVTSEAGIDFIHFPARRQSLLPEDMGSGLAWGDFDDDGYPDLFLVNFQAPLNSPPDPAAGRCALYRNNGDGTFTDISRDAGLDVSINGMGTVWGDFNNNGRLDLYVTAYGPNLLFVNNGDGTFSDVTVSAGVGDPGFSAGAIWFDYDRDGWLDLYVTNYVDFELRPEDLQTSRPQYETEVPYTINPSSYPPTANRLYRNNGDGSFSDIAAQAGVDNPSGRSLQAVAFDFDLDNALDLYVANDISANGVFHNQDNGRFGDIGASSLAADYRGAMGLAVSDFNQNGLFDLFITHWVAQENALFRNMTLFDPGPDEGKVLFMEVSEILGLGYSSLRMVGWATGFADFDNDAMVDLWVVNGHTLQQRDDPARLVPQPLQLYRQSGPRGFIDIAERAWPTARPLVGRGGGHADFDGDGRMDLAILVHGNPAILLRNETPDPGNWFALRLRQSEYNTRAIGARVQLRTGEQTQMAQQLAGSSYLSQNHSDLHFGLGQARSIDELIIHWPDGQTETLEDLPVNQVLERIHQPLYDERNSQ